MRLGELARPASFLAGLAIDWRLGDPPTSAHPVGWIGRAASTLRARAPEGEAERLRYGIAVGSALPLAAAMAATLAARTVGRPHRLLEVGAEAALFSTAVSLRTLLDRASEVQRALEAGHATEARAQLGRHLVSRETSTLTESELAAATIESLAENLSDGFVAPALAYAVGGLPAAAAYRAVNTLDAMWGYREGELAALGRHPARLDDALNLVPSRVTAAAIVLAAVVHRDEGYPWRRALDVWLDEGDFTSSPNAGQPMGAMAGALGVTLAKPGEYQLGRGLAEARPADIERAARLALTAASIVAGTIAGGLTARALAR